jgi:Phosphotransferase enzyme family
MMGRMVAERELKPAWSAIPPGLRAEVTRVLGVPVARAQRTYGGYAPSATFKLTLADGTHAFFKGTYPLPEGSGVVWSLAREEIIYRRLGAVIRPWAPRYIGSVRTDGWHAVLLEHVGGVPLLPWTRTSASRALRSYAAFHQSTIGQALPRWLSRTQHRAFSAYWRRLARDEGALGRLAGLAGQRRDEATNWLRSYVPMLGRAERALARAAEPYGLLHFDTRSDNLRLDGSLLRIFDWPSASTGPVEFDAAAFVQSIEAEGGPPCETSLAWYESVLPLRHDVLMGSAAGIAGYFADGAPRDPVPGLPRLRAVQRSQLGASLRWVARLLDLPEPTWLTAEAG